LEERAWTVTVDDLVQGHYPKGSKLGGAFIFCGGFVGETGGRIPVDGIMHIVRNATVVGIVGTSWEAILNQVREHLDNSIGKRLAEIASAQAESQAAEGSRDSDAVHGESPAPEAGEDGETVP